MDQDLLERYREIESDELISIAFSSEDEYTKEASLAAAAVLRERGISLEAESTTLKARQIKKDQEKKRVEYETESLTKNQKIWFTILPGLAYWYIFFKQISPDENIRKQRIREANIYMFLGIAIWITFCLIIVFMQGN